MKRTLQELSAQLGCKLVGAGSSTATGVSSLNSATSESLVFVEDRKQLEAALASPALAVISGDFASSVDSGKPLLISSQPRLAFARAARILRDGAQARREIHPSAIVSASAHLGKNVGISARTVIGKDVHVGDETTIGAGCVFGDGVEIGSHCRFDANVTIYPGTTIGDRVVIQAGVVLGSEGFGYVRDQQTGRYEQFPQVGRLVIEDEVEIGANSTVDRGALDETRIRRGTKIDNLVHVGHNVQIGEDVVIAAQTGLSGSAVIEDHVIIGGQVGLGDHVHLESGTGEGLAA